MQLLERWNKKVEEIRNPEYGFQDSSNLEKNDGLQSEGSSVKDFSKHDITPNDVAAIVPTTDDESLPANTLRMWTISVGLATLIAGVDAFFQMRYPSVSVSAIVAMLLAYPLGNLWYLIFPDWSLKLPFGYSIELNPGRFNQKEHACVYIFVNLCISAGLINSLLVEQIHYFGVDIGIGRAILFNSGCYLLSWGWAGLALPILVYPATQIWPSVLSNCALLKTLHDSENEPANNWKVSRIKFFLIVFACSFVWYWFPDLIFPALSTIGGWITWIKPQSAALSQVFGVKTGLGLFPLTLDWAQVTSLTNPLVTPFWASACIFSSFVFWIWIVMPGLYYQNHWNTAYFPIMTNQFFDVEGKPYKAEKVVNEAWQLVAEKYHSYSPVMLPIAFLLNLALSLGAFAAMMMSFFLNFKKDVIVPVLKASSHKDVHNRIMYGYKKFHWSVYLVSAVAGLALGFAYCEGWNHELQIRAYGYVVSLVICGCLFIPLALIESRSSFQLSLTVFMEVISAFWKPGEPMTLLYFMTFGYSVLQHAMHTTQSTKIGHYMKVPPRLTATVLFASGIWSSLCNSSVVGWILYHIDDICTPDAANNMNCRSTQTSFNTHLVWGLAGNHLFSPGDRYGFVLWFFLVGALLSIAVWLLQQWKPNNFTKSINPALLMGGAGSIPKVTGFNYSTWAVVGFFFNFFIHRNYNPWWKKYNLVLAIALDCGVAIAAILIYFCIVYTGASDNFSWWGTTVGTDGCDANGCSHLPIDQLTPPIGW
ncbi:hypothetical protein TRICI_003303 [Trichomonascus ciferrii]|uniref:OPT family small oligopeptide transporter n=1 Tax=Trichomonascus ciferrii TaxID=44093 RepID=A0A642V4A2_9ASCO|nr:hypothetical protein TRICI_003303 [Trichomonascus ciferrii]